MTKQVNNRYIIVTREKTGAALVQIDAPKMMVDHRGDLLFYKATNYDRPINVLAAFSSGTWVSVRMVDVPPEEGK